MLESTQIARKGQKKCYILEHNGYFTYVVWFWANIAFVDDVILTNTNSVDFGDTKCMVIHKEPKVVIGGKKAT